MTLRRSLAVPVLALCAVLVAAPAVAALNAYLKLDGVPGESKDPSHPGWIEVESYQLGALGGPDTFAARKASLRSFAITKRHDKASPKLSEAAASGKHFPQVTLTCRKAGGGQQEYLKYELKDVYITSYQLGGSAGGAAPTESLTINFASIELLNAPPSRGAAAAQKVAPAAVAPKR